MVLSSSAASCRDVLALSDVCKSVQELNMLTRWLEEKRNVLTASDLASNFGALDLLPNVGKIKAIKIKKVLEDSGFTVTPPPPPLRTGKDETMDKILELSIELDRFETHAKKHGWISEQ